VPSQRTKASGRRHNLFSSAARNSWLLALSYSNNRPYLNNIPLPGFAYIIRGDRFNAMIGFPFISADYRPDPDWDFRFSIAGGVSFSLED